MREAVCALGSLRLMGGTQNLIICYKMVRGEHLAGSDCSPKGKTRGLPKKVILSSDWCN